ncbi:MAG: four helix bundle protein [Clostridia bacterium]|nr:four helix bundle protein [Clostridia bacterium]
MEKRKGETAMKENKLADMSMDFSIQILQLVNDLKAKHETLISNQIGRSGTSIGANLFEANYAQGKKDFVSKLEIALKEASETGYWLELLYRMKYIDQKTFKTLNDQCTTIRVLIVKSCRTVKKAQEET